MNVIAAPNPGQEAVRLLEAQRAASAAVPSVAERQESLRRLGGALADHRDAFVAAISADFGNRSRPETLLAEIAPALSAMRFARKNLPGWARPRRRRVGASFRPGRAWIEYRPLGCVGIVSPWNYPLLLTLSPLADALAAGNRVLLKPSELTPRFAELLAAVIGRAFEPTQVAVVLGGAEVGAAFAKLPLDHLLFTGSASVGRKVMAAAAETLTPVTLELGGKSPALVLDDYPLARAARSVAIGKFFNAGQTCIAPDYALVPAAKAEAFASAVLDAARALYPAVAANPDYTAIISDRHRTRIEALVAEAEAAGARVLRHGAGSGGGRIEPMVVLGAPDTCGLMQDEIFGPVLPVLPYATLDDALAALSARPRPLALYCWTDDRASARRVLDETVSGGVTLNSTLLHCAQDDLPFGGVGPSGMGAYHGHDGFLRFSHARSVFKPGRFNGFETLVPPHGRLTGLALRLLVR
jgi:coniferyl-aldehyde dehydrogenase